MFRYLLNRLLQRAAVRARFASGRIELFQNGRKIPIGGQFVMHGFEIDVSSIISWDDEPSKTLTEQERKEVAFTAKGAMEAQWGWNVRICNYSPATYGEN